MCARVGSKRESAERKPQEKDRKRRPQKENHRKRTAKEERRKETTGRGPQKKTIGEIPGRCGDFIRIRILWEGRTATEIKEIKTGITDIFPVWQATVLYELPPRTNQMTE